MSFIRVKKVKNYEYAYLVENSWKRRKGSRQKVKKFLGRVYKPEVKDDLEIVRDEKYVKTNSFRAIIRDLVEMELLKHNLSDVTIDFESCVVMKNGKKTVLQLNEGFLCNYTLGTLINFKLDGSDAGYGLANVFVEAGINVPQDLFVKIFEKLS